MTDQELTLAVARAMGYPAVAHTECDVWAEIDGFQHDYNPLHSWADAGPLIGWLTERGHFLTVRAGGCFVKEALALETWADHPTKDAAIRRCLCEAVAAVHEGER